VYFTLSPHLPPGAQHAPFRVDWGLAVDFWICLCFYGLLGMLRWFRL